MRLAYEIHVRRKGDPIVDVMPYSVHEREYAGADLVRGCIVALCPNIDMAERVAGAMLEKAERTTK